MAGPKPISNGHKRAISSTSAFLFQRLKIQAASARTFTYKTHSIVGELGRNVADLRHSIQNDSILQCFAAKASDFETALTHTRWASVGSITEENCHPVNNYTTIQSKPAYPRYSQY